MSDVEQLLKQVRDDPEARELLAELLLETMLVFGDRDRLSIHPTAKVNNAVLNLSSGTITVGEYSFFGHGVSVLTGSHEIEKFGAERQDAIPKEGNDITIGKGVWVASNATIVGPCTIGDHAVVGVGSVVMDDVEPYQIVAGAPAKVIKTIDHEGGG